MREWLVAVAAGVAIGITSCIFSDTFARKEAVQERTVVLFFDEINSTEVEESLPLYEGGVAAIGERLRDCGQIELHFVPSQNFIHSQPFVAVFWDELNDTQADCVMRMMKSQSVSWLIDESKGPTHLGLRELQGGSE